jgi:hypothetical protein
MNAEILIPTRNAGAIDDICRDLRAGHGSIVPFGEGLAGPILEVAAPKGVRRMGLLCVATVPTLRLWPTRGFPIAVAAANRGFPAALDKLGESATPLVGDDLPALLALLAAVRDLTAGMRLPIPKVGSVVTSAGRACHIAWASALPLGDVQAAFLKSVA